MTQTVNVPGVGSLNFPDGMSQADMAAAIKKNYPEIHKSPSVMNEIGGAGETALHLITGGVGGLGGGLGYLGTLAASGGDTGAAQAVQQSIQDKLTYQPRTQAGQLDVKAAGDLLPYLGQKEGQASGDWVMDKTGSPALAAGAETLANLPQMLLGAKAGTKVGGVATDALAQGLRDAAVKSKGDLANAASENVIRDAAIQRAKDAGLHLTPNQAGGSLGSLVEGLSGSPRLERGISIANQPKVNRMMREDIGLGPHEALSKENITKAKEPAWQAYKDMGQLGTFETSPDFLAEVKAAGRPTSASFETKPSAEIADLKETYAVPKFNAADAVQEIRQLRSDAKANQLVHDDPKANALGSAQRDIADALESELERQGAAQGKPELVDNFRAARTKLAKIFSAEEALNTATGNVKPAQLAKQLDRGVKLSGNQLLIAESYKAFEKSFQSPDKLPHERPLALDDVALGALMEKGGSGNIAEWALARPLTRAFLKSDMYQRAGIGPGSYKPGMATALAEALGKQRGNTPPRLQASTAKKLGKLLSAPQDAFLLSSTNALQPSQ